MMGTRYYWWESGFNIQFSSSKLYELPINNKQFINIPWHANGIYSHIGIRPIAANQALNNFS